MVNDAIINKQLIILTEEEQSKAAKFHKSRIAFIYVNGQIQYNEDDEDDRDHMHWAMADYDISYDEFEKAKRGYISKGKIFFYQGSDFSKVEIEEISLQDLVDLIDKHNQYFNNETILVYSGMKIGKVGEIWKPLSCILIIKNS